MLEIIFEAGGEINPRQRHQALVALAHGRLYGDHQGTLTQYLGEGLVAKEFAEAGNTANVAIMLALRNQQPDAAFTAHLQHQAAIKFDGAA